MPPKKKSVSLPPNKQERETRTTRSKAHLDQQKQQPKKTKIKDSEQEEDPLPKKKGGKGGKEEEKSKKKSKKQQKSKQSKQEEQQQKQQQKSQTTGKAQKEQQKPMKKMLLKGTIPVDLHFSRPAQFKIFTDPEKVYAATLNQSNVSANNNKFYIIQLLQNEKCETDFILFTRWGRVGVQGQSSQQFVRSKDVGIREYNKKLREKMKSYRVVQMNYEENAEEKEETKAEKKDQPKSSLNTQVQDLIRLIFDMKMMNKQMKEIGFDANKMPLGKLAKSSILKGYQILKEIMNEIKGHNRKDVVKNLTSSFYSQIPHNFGFQNMANFVLDNEKKVKEKLEMLQSLQDIQVFTKLLDEGSGDNNVNELDSNYNKLNMNITPLDKSSPPYKLLLQYVANTHAKTHTAYKLEVMDIFELEKEVEVARYRKDIGNKQLLWHGSRLTNFVGILSQGLRIAPPEAPVTGYMFGKGVYFADMVTKSANYCFTSRDNNVGLMLLCEVALGEINEKFYADYYANLLPEGKHSTKGCGKNAPKQGKMLGEVLVPCGEGVQTGIINSALIYNEFIVYDVAQIKCRYLFKMKFHYL